MFHVVSISVCRNKTSNIKVSKDRSPFLSSQTSHRHKDKDGKNNMFEKNEDKITVKYYKLSTNKPTKF